MPFIWGVASLSTIIVGACFATALAAFGCFVLMVYFPAHWARFIEWENDITLKCGLSPTLARWMKEHETGGTMKVIMSLIVFASTTAVFVILHRIPVHP